MDKLTESQAYAAMLLFLGRYCKNTKSADVAILIGSMRVVTNGGTWETFDPGYWDEWKEDIEKVLEASKSEEAWEQFIDDYLAYKITAPDGTVLRAKRG